MKKLLYVFAAIAISTGAYAQTDAPNRRTNQPDINNTNDGLNTNDGMNHNRNVNNRQNQIDRNNPDGMNQNRNVNSQQNQNQNNRNNHDGVMMQNGKMMVVKNGQITPLDHDITMSNGTRITRNGDYINKDGTKMMMKERQHMDMSGNMIPTETDKDKNMYLVPDDSPKEE